MAKFGTNGNFIFGTYYGGKDEDIGNGIALNAAEEILITGTTKSTNLISTIGSYQSTGISGPTDNAFITKFGTAGLLNVSPNTGVCHGKQAVLTVSGALNYTWAPAEFLNTSTGASVIASPTANTTFTVTDNNGPGIGTVTVIIFPDPTIVLTDKTLCTGTGGLVLSGAGASTYTWSPATGFSSTTGSPTANPPIGTYTYVATGTDINQCVASASMVLTVAASPLVSASSDITICSGASTQLTAAGATTYQWSPATVPATGATVTASPAGTQTYTVTGSDGICPGKASIKITINPPPTVDAGLNDSIISGETYTIITTASQSGLTYSWRPASTSNASTAIVSPLSATTYYVKVTDPNECSSLEDSITIFVSINCSDVFIPDAFSPNGDGVNDVLELNILNKNCIEYMTFELYDRWGTMIFYTEDINTTWDGNFNGKKKSPGIYVYVFNAHLINGQVINTRSFISLYR